MRQIAQSYRTGELSITDVADPSARSGFLLVATSVSLISAGTERAIVDLAKKNLLAKARERPDLVAKVLTKVKREGMLAAFDAVQSKLGSPIPLGYSLSGKIADVGRGTMGFAVGDRVACAGAGWANHAEINTVPQNLTVRVPDAVSDEEASFVTVGAIALHGVRLARPTLGEIVVVIGLGLLGQIAVSLLTAHGCDVVGIDVDRSKIERAIARGAIAGAVSGADDCAEIVRSVTNGRGADAVVITASSPTNDPLVVAGEIARDRARVSIVGNLPIEIPRATYFEKELEVVVSRSYGPGRYDPAYEEHGQDYPIGYVRWTERRNMEAVLRAIATKKLDVASLVTHRFAFERALDAYGLITDKQAEPHLGVLLTYPPAEPKSKERAVVTAVPKRASRGAPLGVAVVGTGSFATGILLPHLAKLGQARLVAAVSARGLSARHVVDRFCVDRVAPDLDSLLGMDDVDAVVIATRHASHADQAIRALDAGRHVFVEKPAAIDEAQLQRLALAATRPDAPLLMVGFNRRFAPFAQNIHSAFANRRAGLVMQARINAGLVPGESWLHRREEGGGRVIGEACHFIDLMSFWAGSEPQRVSAHAIAAPGGYRRDDNLVVTISFGDGSVGTLVYTAMGDASIGKERYEVFCEGIVATIDDWRTMTVTKRGKTKTTRSLKADKGHPAELDAFVAACVGGSRSPIAWTSLEATTRTTFAIETAWMQSASVEI